MTVSVLEVEPSPLTTSVDLHILRVRRPASVSNALRLHPIKDGIEVFIVHMEGIVVALKLVSVIEIECKGIVNLHRCDVSCKSLVLTADLSRM